MTDEILDQCVDAGMAKRNELCSGSISVLATQSVEQLQRQIIEAAIEKYIDLVEK